MCKVRNADPWQRHLPLSLFSPLAVSLVPPENTSHPPTTGEMPNCVSVTGLAPKCLSVPKPANSIQPRWTPTPGEGRDGEPEASTVRLLPKQLTGGYSGFLGRALSIHVLCHLGNLGRGPGSGMGTLNQFMQWRGRAEDGLEVGV